MDTSNKLRLLAIIIIWSIGLVLMVATLSKGSTQVKRGIERVILEPNNL